MGNKFCKTTQIFIFFLFFFNCAKNDQEETESSTSKFQEINLVKEREFGDCKEVTFGRMGLFDIDQYGRLYIAESKKGDRKVHVFADDGKYLTQLSREGDGPGEYRTLKSLSVISNKIYLYDSFHNRLSVFNQYTDSLQFQLEDEMNLSDLIPSNVDVKEGESLSDIFIFKNGTILIGLEDPMIPNNPEREIKYYLYEKDSASGSRYIFKQKAINIFSTKAGTSTVTMQLPFSGKPLIEVTELGLIFNAWSEQFKVDVLNLDGQNIRSISIPFQNIKLEKDTVIQWYKPYAGFYKAIQQASFPETWPAIENMLIDDENRLWISTIVEDFDIYEWWVLEETGEMITRFKWPRNKPIKVIRNSAVYTLETDEETGLQQVVRYAFELAER